MARGLHAMTQQPPAGADDHQNMIITHVKSARRDFKLTVETVGVALQLLGGMLQQRAGDVQGVPIHGWGPAQAWAPMQPAEA